MKDTMWQKMEMVVKLPDGELYDHGSEDVREHSYISAILALFNAGIEISKRDNYCISTSRTDVALITNVLNNELIGGFQVTRYPAFTIIEILS